MRSFSFVLIAIFGLGFASERAEAFPELVRHGYTNCTACHTSLVGGNLLNPYGRSLARALVSQKTLGGHESVEGDEAFLFGFAKTPEWLDLGGDIRLLQAFYESKAASRARFMIMQVDVDASARVGDRYRVFASLGRIEPKSDQPTAIDFVSSPRHGIEVVLGPTGAADRWTLRAGRFMPAYGILFAEHTLVTRTLLGFMPGQERVAAELAYVNDFYSVIATGIGAQTSGNQVKNETGGILQAAMGVRTGSKVGVNYYQTRAEDTGVKFDRKIAGAFAHLKIDDNTYALVELDRPETAGKAGVMDVVKVGYEVDQGLQVFAIQEFANLDSSKVDPKFEAYSLGTEWFPRPHWDLYGLVRRERNTAVSDSFDSAVWLVGHFYL